MKDLFFSVFVLNVHFGKFVCKIKRGLTLLEFLIKHKSIKKSYTVNVWNPDVWNPNFCVVDLQTNKVSKIWAKESRFQTLHMSEV